MPIFRPPLPWFRYSVFPLKSGAHLTHRATTVVYAVSGAGIAVIVNNDNPVDNLSCGSAAYRVGRETELERQDPTRADDTERGSRERILLLQKACHMTDAEYHQYWTRKIFSGDVTSEPVSLPSVGTALDFVSSIKGGISFVDVASVRPGIKVIRIDGHLPGEQGYPIQ